MTHEAPRRDSDGGFTLAEICIAMILIAIISTGVAAMGALAVKACGAARVQSSTTMLANQKLEQLRALTWAVDSAGVAISDWSTDVSREPETSGGTGLGASPANSLDVNTPGYADYLNVSGIWVGAGAAPSSSARYIRRWNVRPLAGDPDVVVLQVLVTTVERDRQAAQPRRRLADDAFVTTVMARKVR